MTLKTVEIEGTKYAALTDDGKPVYIGDDGAETGYDGETLAARLSEVNGESATRRRELKEANEKLKAFEGIEDPASAIKALDTVKSLDDKKLIEAGEVEKVKAEAIKATEGKWEALVKEKYEPVVAERDEYKDALYNEMIGSRFARSKFISEKMTVPVEMVQATFAGRFSIEDGKVVAKRIDGKEVYSKSSPGDVADFEEALEIIVTESAMKDHILRGTNKRGTGAPGSGPGAQNRGEKTMTRAEADKLAGENPGEMAKRMADGYMVVDEAA